MVTSDAQLRWRGRDHNGPRRLQAVALLSLTVLLSSACSTGGPSLGSGPLGDGREEGDSSQICMPANGQGQYALGTEVLANPGFQDAVLTDVELVDPVNFTLKDAVVVDIGHMGVGVQSSWPPAGVDAARWQAAVPLDGAVIPAGSSMTKDLVLHLSAPAGQAASLQGFVIRYKVGGAPYAMTTPSAFEVAQECK